MSLLVTGASGFVGRHLVAHLRASGDVPVIEDATDVLELKQLEEAFNEHKPDVIYHLAAQSDVAASWNDPKGTMRVNVDGTINVLAAATSCGAKRMLIISSADVYGTLASSDLPVNESAPMHPVNPYGESKAEAERAAAAGGGLEVVCARAFNHIGPGQSERFVASALAKQIAQNELSGETQVRVGNLEAKRDFADVRDVVCAYRLIVEHGESGAVYNVCTGISRSVRDVADTLLGLARHEMELVVDDQLRRPVDVSEVRGDPSLIHEVTGWTPEIPFETTLADVLEDWRMRVANA